MSDGRGWRRALLLGVGMGMGLLGGGRLVPGQEGEAALQAMAKDGKPQFEVATIRAADPANQNQGFHTRGRRILVENERVSDVVAVAYGVHRAQIVDAPAWFDRERYDIEGVPDLPGYPDLPQMQGMLRRLLEERFGLQLRREQRELPVYAMTVGKGGAKLKKSAGDPSGLPDQTGHGEGEQQVVRFTNCAMSDVALEMQGFLERPVVDQTGLPGRYDFTLRWTPSLAAVPLSAEGAAAAPGIFTAMQEQLGLRLQAVKAAAAVLVVQRVERPSAN